MTKEELSVVLEREGVDPRAYSLTGGLPVERYCLADEGHGRWSVYYSERGLRSGLTTHASESDACRDLLQRVLDDPTTRKR